MAMLAESVDGVIGVDTHRDTLTAAAVTNLGGVLARVTTSADAAGYQRLLEKPLTYDADQPASPPSERSRCGTVTSGMAAAHRHPAARLRPPGRTDPTRGDRRRRGPARPWRASGTSAAGR
jgi:hypothetical protein